MQVLYFSKKRKEPDDPHRRAAGRAFAETCDVDPEEEERTYPDIPEHRYWGGWMLRHGDRCDRPGYSMVCHRCGAVTKVDDGDISKVFETLPKCPECGYGGPAKGE